MFYANHVQDTRQLFFSSWKKYRGKEILSPLEKQIVDVILAHPEYHSVLENEAASHQAYFPEQGQTNPFLHMGLHLAVRDQIALDRPRGIKQVYQQLVKIHANPLSVEHLLMECLAECLWKAQRMQNMPNETEYLQACRQLIEK